MRTPDNLQLALQLGVSEMDEKAEVNHLIVLYIHLADLTVSKRPGASNRIEIHFAVFNHLYLCFSFMKLVEYL